MNLFRYFGIGAKKILAMDCHVPGTVTHVGRSYLYVVKKPVRLYVHEGNTMFSHFIHFTYTVNGIQYKGRLWVSLRGHTAVQAFLQHTDKTGLHG